MTDVNKVFTLCEKSEIGEGEILQVEKNDLLLAVYKVDDEFFVTDDNCTHGPGILSEGYLDGHVIECDFHNGAFDIRNGEVVAPPCMVPLKTYEIIPDDTLVLIAAVPNEN